MCHCYYLRVEDQREEVVGVERATQQELEPWWGCLSRSWDHRETGFLGESRTTEESRPETPLNAKSIEEEECPGFSLPPNLPPVLPIG